MSEICRMCGKERNEHQGYLESCFGPMDERTSHFAPQLETHPVEDLLALARKEERDRCIQKISAYWDSTEYAEDLSLIGLLGAINSSD